MTSTNFDPFGAFFSPERLAYYRELHERFPLWCGDWPIPERFAPEAAQWLRETRLALEAKPHAPEAELAWVEYGWEEPRWSNAPNPTLYVVEEDSGPDRLIERTISPVEPPAVRALFAAIEYVFAKWHSGIGPASTGVPVILADDEPVLEHWKSEFTDLVDSPDLFVGVEPTGRTGWRLLQIRNAYLATPRRDTEQRKSLRSRLHRYWMFIGEDLGIIPQVRGGRSTTLSSDFLKEIVDETVELLEKVRACSLDEDEMDNVRALVADRPVPPHEHRRIDIRMKTGDWGTQLRFPMLTRHELRILRTDARQDAPTVASVARFLEDSERLPYSSSTIENLVSSSQEG
jgi:hypothetical protein